MVFRAGLGVLLAVFLCTHAFAWSPAGSSAGSSAGSPVPSEVVGDQYLHDLVNTNFELDTTIDESVDGETWDSVTASPWDGTAQSVYRFSKVGDPVLTGSGQDRYWYFSAAMFTIADDAGIDFYSSAHKTDGEDFWFAAAGQLQLYNPSAGQVIIGTQSGSGAAGVSVNMGDADKFRMQQWGSAEVEVDTLETYGNDYDYFVVWSHSHSENKTRIWVNGVLSEVAHNFSDSSDDASATLHIAGHGSLLLSGAVLADDSRLKLVAGGQGYISPAQEKQMRDLIETRHNGDYTDGGVRADFDIADKVDIELNTVTTSDIERPGHAYEVGLPISISNGEYRLCSDSACSSAGSWTTASGTIYGYQWVQLRVTSSATNSTAVTATLTIDQTNVAWAVTTVSGAEYLDSVISSVIADLDATIADSYTSGQTWANLIAAPADGSSQTAYDFIRGSGVIETTADPTFNGTAGSASAYWSFDGGDYFRLKGSNTTFLDNLHRSTGGTDYWIAVAFNKADATHGTETFFSTAATAATSGSGINLAGTTLETTRLQQLGASSVASQTGTSAELTAGCNIVIASYDFSEDQWTVWQNSATADQTETFSRVTSTSAAAAAAHIGVTGDGSTNPFTSETQLYHLSFGNEYLDNTKAGAIITHLETRHARDCTP